MTRIVTIECTMKEENLFHFVFAREGAWSAEHRFSLTAEEITEIGEREYPTLPNRYQFGFGEIVVGKMVLALTFLYTVEDIPGKTIQVTEKA